jgi:hypothetical protein
VVWAFTAVSSRENRNSFHEARNAKIAVTAMPPDTTGSTTRTKVPSLPQPSTLAASSMSTGTASKKLAISQIDSGSEMVVWASASPVGVSFRPTALIMPTSGTPIATGGTMRVTSAAIMNTRPLTVPKRVMP